MRQITGTALCLLLVASIAVSSTSARVDASPYELASAVEISAEQGTLPDAPGRDVVERVCASCHGTDILTMMESSPAGWRETVDLMKQYGAMASDADWKTVSDYLVANLARLSVNKGSAEDLALVLGLTSEAGAKVAAYRDAQGGFKTIDDLKKAPDVNGARVDAVRARLIFE